MWHDAKTYDVYRMCPKDFGRAHRRRLHGDCVICAKCHATLSVIDHRPGRRDSESRRIREAIERAILLANTPDIPL